MKVRDILVAGAALALPIAAVQAAPPAQSGSTTSGASPASPGASSATQGGSSYQSTGSAAAQSRSAAPEGASQPGASVTQGAGSVSQDTSGAAGTQAGGAAAGAPASGAGQASGGIGGATANAVQPVTQSDLAKGAQVFDTAGGSVGTIESAEADGAVISTGKVRAKVPLTGLGKTDKGLVLGMTKDQLEAAAGGAKPTQGS